MNTREATPFKATVSIGNLGEGLQGKPMLVVRVTHHRRSRELVVGRDDAPQMLGQYLAELYANGTETNAQH